MVDTKEVSMAPIILIVIVILAFIALCNGDPSGVKAIVKIMGVGAFIFGAFWIFAYCPWIIIVIIIGSILVAIICNSSNGSHINKEKSNNTINQTNANVETKSNIIQEPSNFQRQLQENTKTLQQVEDENWLKEKEQISLIANNNYADIKRKLLDKAKNGQYTTSNGQKNISLEYCCLYLLGCVDRQYFRNPTGRMGTSSYRSNEKVYYHISKAKEYNLYLTVIKDLALKDNVSINLFFTEIDVPHNRENRITLPYTFTHKYGIGVSTHKIKAYLECSIQY